MIKQINMMSGAKVDFDKATQDAQERFFNVVGASMSSTTPSSSSYTTGTPEQIQIAQQMISEKVSPRPGGSFGQATMGYNTLGANLSQPTTAYDQYAAYSAQVYQQQQSGGYGQQQQQGYGQQQAQGGAQTEGMISVTRWARPHTLRRAAQAVGGILRTAGAVPGIHGAVGTGQLAHLCCVAVSLFLNEATNQV